MQTYKKKSNSKKYFKIVDDFMKEKCIKWSDYVGVCMDAAHVMAGNKVIASLK
jgi:hypothetical protein